MIDEQGGGVAEYDLNRDEGDLSAQGLMRLTVLDPDPLRFSCVESNVGDVRQLLWRVHGGKLVRHRATFWVTSRWIGGLLHGSRVASAMSATDCEAFDRSTGDASPPRRGVWAL